MIEAFNKSFSLVSEAIKVQFQGVPLIIASAYTCVVYITMYILITTQGVILHTILNIYGCYKYLKFQN